MRVRVMDALRVGLVVCGLALLGCTDVTDVRLLEISATGNVVGTTFLDLNGNGVADAPDVPMASVAVTLTPATGGAAIEAMTDNVGAFAFQEVPVGRYTVEIAPGVLADSLIRVGTQPPLEVVLDGTVQVVLGASYPALTLEEVRAAAPGRRVFTAGIALNARQSSGDGRVFLQEGDAYLQATDVDRNPAVAVGDSVRFLGYTSVQDGQPTLDGVSPIILVRQARVPAPLETSTGDAADAASGSLDAALVRIRDADISDTMTVDGDFHFRADDGTGPVEVVLRSFLGSAQRPDEGRRVTQAVGMLAPHDDGSGSIRWRLLVRTAQEIVTGVRQADMSVTGEVMPTSARQGDIVEFRVIVSNAGPRSVESFQVFDTLNVNLTRVSHTATRGTYQSTGTAGSWTLGSLDAGAADTLTISAEVTGGDTGTVTHVVRIGPLQHVVDPSLANNRFVTNLLLQAP